ncbi:MAG TPA: ribosomal L7Ae/L30e/S12e/Gadd45 family protein [Symbiobacteriaceae bacterium]|nr:ribosomal L7Ae/L30e/S12e/Gadd45 family protein [Symbiobacteriaceae bacterium]
MIPKSLEQMLGLCQRAGKVASGDLAAEQALKKRKADLLILAEDASERTREKFIGLAASLNVPVYTVGTRDELGLALGKAHRAAVVVQSRDFKKGIVGILEKEGLTPVPGRG